MSTPSRIGMAPTELRTARCNRPRNRRACARTWPDEVARAGARWPIPLSGCCVLAARIGLPRLTFSRSSGSTRTVVHIIPAHGP